MIKLFTVIDENNAASCMCNVVLQNIPLPA